MLRLCQIILLVAGILTLSIGDTPWSDILHNFLARVRGEDPGWNPLLHERLPRLLVLACTGASLSVAGAVNQSLFRNPLVSPSILGLTFGGSLCVVMAFIAGWNLRYPFAIPMLAVFGCFITLLIVYQSACYRGSLHLTQLVLHGIAIATVLMAIQKALLFAMRDQWHLMQTIAEWEAGCTTDRTWQHVHMQLPLTLFGLLGCWRYRHELNILALGEEEASSLGIDVRAIRWRLFLCVAMLTGGALAGLGIIAFFGLLLPHIFRRLQGPNNNALIPLCTFGGAALLTSLEVLIRLSGFHLFSIGNVSSLLGGFFFLALIFGGRGRENLAF